MIIIIKHKLCKPTDASPLILNPTTPEQDGDLDQTGISFSF